MLLVYLDTSKIEWIIYRQDLHNLDTKNKTKKKLKEQLIVAKEVSVNVKTKTSLKYNYFPGFLSCLKNA